MFEVTATRFHEQRRRLRHWSTASSTILCCRPDHSCVVCYQATRVSCPSS